MAKIPRYIQYRDLAREIAQANMDYIIVPRRFLRFAKVESTGQEGNGRPAKFVTKALLDTMGYKSPLFRQEFRRLRKTAGISQTKLAESAGKMKQEDISDFENLRDNFTEERTIRLCRALDKLL